MVSLSAVLCSILLKASSYTDVGALVNMVCMNLVKLLLIYEFNGILELWWLVYML